MKGETQMENLFETIGTWFDELFAAIKTFFENLKTLFPSKEEENPEA